MAEYKLYADRGVMIKKNNPTAQFPLGETIPLESESAMVVLFSNPASTYAFKRILSCNMNAYASFSGIYGGTTLRIQTGLPYQSLPLDKITWENAFNGNSLNTKYDSQVLYSAGYYVAGFRKDEIRQALSFGVIVRANLSSLDNAYIQTPYGSNKPYILFDLADDDVGLTISNLSPAGGYVSKHAESKFTWSSVREYDSISEVKPASTIFRWRAGETGTIHTISVGTESSITIPAETFTADEIQWSVQITANSGITTTSEWKTLSTVEDLSIANGLSPSGQIIDNQSETLFSWQHVISTGTEQTGFDLQTSTDGTSWSTLVTETTNRQTYLAAAGTFLAGTLYWRVRTYNTDRVAGEWSSPLMVIVIGAPLAPAVAIESDQPRWAIRWSQKGQQGYEVEFDGVRIASAFGQESRYQYTGWAEPGVHVVRVRIQNEYSMWSEWGAASLTITNQQGAEIVLTVIQDDNTPVAALSWTGSSDRYVIYRNGKIVGETTNNTFVDKFGNGVCTYQVRGVSDSNGYYTISEPVAVTILPENFMLYDIRNKVWLDLARSATQARETNETMTRAASFLHFAGSEKPSVEFGEATDRSISFVCAFVADEYGEKAKFEASVGGMVCLKLQDGKAIVGALNAYTRSATTFYTVYQASVIEAEFDEVASND